MKKPNVLVLGNHPQRYKWLGNIVHRRIIDCVQLDDYTKADEVLENIETSPREYFAEMQIQEDCALIGKGIEEAGLRHLPGLFSMEIVRGEKLISPVRPEEVMAEGDILTFAGVVSTMVDLERKIQGLVPVVDDS